MLDLQEEFVSNNVSGFIDVGFHYTGKENLANIRTHGIQNVGVTVLIATHDITLINRMQLRIMHLEEGELTDDGAGYGR